MSAAFTLDDTLRGTVLCWLATVDAEGQPSVSPKEMWVMEADRFRIADIASGGSVRAIRGNPKVCVSLLDIFRERGHKLIGTAQIIAPQDKRFAELAAPLIAKAGPDYPVRNVIDVTVYRAIPIIAPGWHIFPDRDPEDHLRRTQDTYAARLR